MNSKIKVNFINKEMISAWRYRQLRRVFVQAISFLQLKLDTVNVVFLKEKKIKELNNLYRDKNKVTDVLSFFYEENRTGEIYICPAQAVKQADTFGHNLTKELSQLLIHGLVHLAGYDHAKDLEATKMAKLENKIYKAYEESN